MSVLNFQNVHVTLVVVPTDLRCGYARLCSIAENDLGLNLSGGKEAIVFISKTRRICKIITNDSNGTILITRTLNQGRFEQIFSKSHEVAKCSLTNKELEDFLNGKRLFVKKESFW